MKKSMILFLLLFLFPFITNAQEWDTFDKILFISLIAFHTADFLQTNYIFDHQDEYYEKNMFIKEGVNQIGKSFIPLYFAAFTSFEFWFANKLNFKNRKIWLSVCALNSASFVAGNMALGISFSF